MRGLILAACVAAAMPWPAAAVTVLDFSYSGRGSYTPPRGSPTEFQETGLGRLEFDEAPGTAALGAGLLGFSFTTELAQKVSPVGSDAYVVPGRVSYELADLRTLKLSYSNGQLTALSFETNSKAASYGTATRVSFIADTVPNGMILGRTVLQGGPGISGLVTAVPEPGSWVMLILGFGALGTALRRRRAGLTIGSVAR